MIIAKLVVLFFFISIVLTSSSRYCRICPNHTLCKYKMSGPSASCHEYDESNLLSEDDVHHIVNRINERRNFIAKGMSKLFPHAANMNKIRWSGELAAFAQRWADQCDPSTRPDKEDECRDLEDTGVGQSITSVVGPTPGMQIRSLIDIWFTGSLDYRGTVTYYNYTRDWKTNYFTQVIWGETDRVGCGKAKFYLKNRNTLIERLVCNFAPKGNVHGKPVYIRGYPASLCQKNMAPDKEFDALCAYWSANNGNNDTLHAKPVSSLLRILNLSNNSIKRDIDPVRNDFKVKSDPHKINEQRNQKTRHVFLNNSYVAMKNNPHLQMYNNNWNRAANFSRIQQLQQYHQERGHSRVYHGHDLHDNNFGTERKQTADQNFRRFDNPTEMATQISASNDLRKYNKYNDCTRRNLPMPIIPIRNDCTTCETTANQCTRRHGADCITPNPCQQCPNPQKILFQHSYPHERCPCNTPTTCAPTLPKCQCNINCQCLKIDCGTTPCPLVMRRNDDTKDGINKPAEFHYYDLSLNAAVRSGGHMESQDIFEPTIKNASPHLHSTLGNNLKKRINIERLNKKEYDSIYDSPYSRVRKKRSPEDEITFKPFWQMEEFNNQRPGQLKSMIYTTLRMKYKKLKGPATTVRIPITTETITFKLTDTSGTNKQKNIITEKYLSFDELMHLRRIGSTEVSSINARRSDEKTSTTIEYTTNTPFERKKHCTRKITCTWTMATLVDANGSVIITGIEGGSRTPPGYVDGCTRTSTCTRDFMDRNKFSTLSSTGTVDSSFTGDGDSDGNADGDYCDKRALIVRRHDFNNMNMDKELKLSTESDSPPTPYYISDIETKVTYTSTDLSIPTISSLKGCVCLDDHGMRIKRNKIRIPKQEIRYDDNLSYGDLFYLVLQKIISKWKNNENIHNMKCSCNTGAIITGSVVLLIFLFLLYSMSIQLFIV